MLDWKAEESPSKGISANNADEGTKRVLVVDIIHLLRKDGAFAQVIKDMVDDNDVWKAYSQQKHDLFLPSNASDSTGVAGLLTGQAAVYALPPATSK